MIEVFSKTGRSRWWVAGLSSLLVLVIAGVIVWRVTRDDDYVAPPPSAVPAVGPDVDGASAALEQLAGGVRRGEAPQGDAAADVVMRNAAALHVGDFSARYVDEAGAVDADGSWIADVDVTWRFAGFDSRSVTEEVPVGFKAAGGAVRITGFGGAPGRLPVWLSGPVTVRRSADTLVLVRSGGKVADEYAHLARTAVATVRKVVPWPHARLVMEVPAGESGLEAAMGADQGDDSEVAAVTATVDGSANPEAPVHIFVNPEVIGDLNGPGAQVVLSHEATHAATHAATNAARPIWLNEGFADYVALRDTRLPLSTTAGQILKQVRRSGPPGHLPDQADFNAKSDTFGAEYEAAWLACRTLASLGGEQALVRLYDQTGSGEPLGAALRSDFGLSVAGFTKAWQQRLSHLAS